MQRLISKTTKFEHFYHPFCKGIISSNSVLVLGLLKKACQRPKTRSTATVKTCSNQANDMTTWNLFFTSPKQPGNHYSLGSNGLFPTFLALNIPALPGRTKLRPLQPIVRYDVTCDHCRNACECIAWRC